MADEHYVVIHTTSQCSWLHATANFDLEWGIEMASFGPGYPSERLSGEGVQLTKNEFRYKSLFTNQISHQFRLKLKDNVAPLVKGGGKYDVDYRVERFLLVG